MTGRQEQAHAWIDHMRAVLRGESPEPPAGFDPERLRLLDEMCDEEERR